MEQTGQDDQFGKAPVRSQLVMKDQGAAMQFEMNNCNTAALYERVKEQGDLVRKLKAEKASKLGLSKA